MRHVIIIFLFCIPLISCEDVIDVNLNTSAPKLVIDGSILKNIATDNAIARVKLTTTTPFFNNQPSYVTDAQVTIISGNGISFQLPHTGNGLYILQPFPAEEDVTYTIEIQYDNELYSATETLQPVVPLEYVEQRNDGGFSGEDIELKAFFTDPANEVNYYFFEGLSVKGNVYDAYNDEFFDGNPIFGFYFNEDLESGDLVTFYLHGANEQFYNFMFVLLQQSTDQSDGPFETQPATVRGNLVNETNPDNYPLGYFRVAEVSILSYTVQ